LTFEFICTMRRGSSDPKFFRRGQSKSRNIRNIRTFLINQGLARNIMRNIAQRIRTMQKRGFKRGKGVASDQFLIEIRRRMKTKKKAQRKLGKKKPHRSGV